MRQHDWYLKGVLTAIAIAMWVLILKPMLLPSPTQAAPARQAAPKVVRAQRFEVVDVRGKLRATLEVQEDGTPCLDLYDAQGLLPRVKLEVLAGVCPWLELSDARHMSRVILAVAADGTPGLRLFGAEGFRPRAILGAGVVATRGGTVETRHEASLVLLDEKDGVIWQAPP